MRDGLSNSSATAEETPRDRTSQGRRSPADKWPGAESLNRAQAKDILAVVLSAAVPAALVAWQWIAIGHADHACRTGVNPVGGFVFPAVLGSIPAVALAFRSRSPGKLSRAALVFGLLSIAFTGFFWVQLSGLVGCGHGPHHVEDAFAGRIRREPSPPDRSPMAGELAGFLQRAYAEGAQLRIVFLDDPAKRYAPLLPLTQRCATPGVRARHRCAIDVAAAIIHGATANFGLHRDATVPLTADQRRHQLAGLSCAGCPPLSLWIDHGRLTALLGTGSKGNELRVCQHRNLTADVGDVARLVESCPLTGKKVRFKYLRAQSRAPALGSW